MCIDVANLSWLDACFCQCIGHRQPRAFAICGGCRLVKCIGRIVPARELAEGSTLRASDAVIILQNDKCRALTKVQPFASFIEWFADLQIINIECLESFQVESD